ncbi:MAG: PQQ-binding-like beta-propeller repeat protein [Chthoniobacterales bacterium]
MTKVLAFHYDNNNAIQLLWTYSTSYVQFGGSVALGADGSIYVVAGRKLAVLDPADGSIIRSVSFPFQNGCTPALSRGVLWAYSDKQTFALDPASLEVLQNFPSSSGFGLGYISPGAFVRGTAALNDSAQLDVYQETPAVR